MADKVKPADDPKIKAVVGYGFDASIRKGTQNGFTAMVNSSEYRSLDAKGQQAADKLFENRIRNDSNLSQLKGIGDEKVKVYRAAAKEKPARVIDYQKEFGSKPQVAAKKAAPKVDKTPLPNPDMGFRPFAKADKPKPPPARTVGSGMSQMMNYAAFPSKPAAKPASTATKPAAKSTTKTAPVAPIRKAMGMPAAPKSDKVNVPGMGMMSKDAAMRMRAFKK